MKPVQKEIAGWHLSFGRMLWLCASMLLVLAPHVTRIPLWISAVFVLFVAWRLYTVKTGTSLPHRYLLGLVVMLILLGVYLSYHTLTGRNAGVALLAALSGMKILETRNQRDAYVVVFLGFFLVVTNFLYSQSIPTGLYMLVVVMVLTSTLVALTLRESDLKPQHQLRLSAVMLAQAVPIMLAAFLLFPRVPGPLWGLPKDAHSARSGLSDVMRPGNISQLSLSDSVAFRVRFDGPIPPNDKLYWRGPVLWNTDGEAWRRDDFNLISSIETTNKGASAVDYTITLEAHNRRWLFALDLPVIIPKNKLMSSDFELRSPKPVLERIRYRMRSYTQYEDLRASWLDIQRGLALPQGKHPQARALALEWRQTLGGDRAIVERALSYFRNQPFFYTLSPPLLTGDRVDQFLFDTRRGFCEHYASAFAVLMRAAGIPTRVVTGYQGGEVNNLGNFLTVRQRDAHAWTEVWLREGGWTRIDPTAAVAPERIELGMDAAIPPPLGPRVLNIQPSEPVRKLWRNLRQSWDAVNSAWNEWVLGYGYERQRRFLERLGLDSRGLIRMALVLVALVGVLLAGVALWLARRPGTRDPVLRAYRRFQRKLEKRGLARIRGEGPLHYARRVIIARPDLAASVNHITRLYIDLRYGPAADDPRRLNRAVAEFRT